MGPERQAFLPCTGKAPIPSDDGFKARREEKLTLLDHADYLSMVMTGRLWYAIWKETPAHFLRGFKIEMLGTPFTTVAAHSTPSEQCSITLA